MKDYVLEIKESGPKTYSFTTYNPLTWRFPAGTKHFAEWRNITVEADGEGYASFFGNGTYSVENADGMKREGQWH